MDIELPKEKKHNEIKIVYHGTGMSGRTTSLMNLASNIPEATLRSIKPGNSQSEARIMHVTIPPADHGIGGFTHSPSYRIDVYSLCLNIYHAPERTAIFDEVDGVVFVVDSQSVRLAANRDALTEFEAAIHAYGGTVRTIPWVIQYNKRDLPSVSSIKELETNLNPYHVPYTESIASQGIGIISTLSILLADIQKRRKE